ncbi:unnamed protein product, partial [Rotaria sp. Silwood1]
MACATSDSSQPSTRVQWMWNSSVDPFSNSESDEWRPYIDVENMIIEDAFRAGQTHAILDDYNIDFENKIQIFNNDTKKRRPIKRIVRNTDEHNVRGDRFTFAPIDPKHPFGGLYGWISPFIKEAAKHLNITKDQLPSKDEKTVPMVVEKAAAGIVEEAKLIAKRCQGENLAKKLMEKKDAGIKE